MKKLIFVTKIVDKKFKCGLYMTDDDDRSRKKRYSENRRKFTGEHPCRHPLA